VEKSRWGAEPRRKGPATKLPRLPPTKWQTLELVPKFGWSRNNLLGNPVKHKIKPARFFH
jgi:hypothetical protein